MKDYRITVKVRNNRILKAIESNGGSPGQKWCESVGLSYNHVRGFINLAISPVDSDGNFSSPAQSLCDVLNSIPDDLWTDEQLRPLERNFSSLEMSHDQVMALLPPSETTYIENFDKFDDERMIREKVATLTLREQDVINMRFGLGNKPEMTLSETGKVLGIKQERVRQIEARALRKLRAHKNSIELLCILNPESVDISELHDQMQKNRK